MRGWGPIFNTFFPDLFLSFDLWAIGGAENTPRRVFFSWCRDSGCCFYRLMLVLRESWGPSPHFYLQMPGSLVLPTSNDWSISAAPAAARAALRAKLQRMAFNLGAIHRARLKAIGVRGGVPFLMICF